jgi:PTS system mannose-specific IIB component/fructoselysine and glucoselysine-specific PTS system IIB component
MPIVLFRVDERLIHGQVVVGWGNQLHPDCFVVVDDDLAGSPWEQELYSLALAPETEATFTTVEEARARVPAWRDGADRIVLLTRDLATMVRLAGDGFLSGEQINLGGIHFAPGRRSFLPYLYLSDDERVDLRRLVDEGAVVSARDLPGTRRVDAGQLLREDVRRP